MAGIAVVADSLAAGIPVVHHSSDRTGLHNSVHTVDTELAVAVGYSTAVTGRSLHMIDSFVWVEMIVPPAEMYLRLV